MCVFLLYGCARSSVKQKFCAHAGAIIAANSEGDSRAKKPLAGRRAKLSIAATAAMIFAGQYAAGASR
jgi:hypothetical protein